MKDRRLRLAAREAVKGVDLIVAPTPDGFDDPTGIPFPISDRDRTAMTLREKRNSVEHQLESIPNVNALSLTVRYLPGGRQRFLEYVKLAAMNGDAAALAFWKVYSDLGKTQRNSCSLDDVVLTAGVKPSSLVAAIVGHGMEAMTDMANLIGATFHPEVVAAMGKSALRLNSEIAADDRKAFLQGRGTIPAPKGTSIHLHANANANAASAANATAAAASVAEPSVPRFAADIAALAAPRSEIQQRLVEEAPDQTVIDAETVA